MLEVGPGLTFLDVLLTEIARHGFDDIILLAGHLGDQIATRYNNASFLGANIRVLREPEPAGTGGALSRIRQLLDPVFLLMNGDSWFDINLRSFAAALPSDALGKIALRQEVDTARFGTVQLQGDRILSFSEKAAASKNGLISCGIYLLRRELVSVRKSAYSLETDAFPTVALKRKLCGEVYDNYFLDIGLPETFEQANREVPRRRRRPAAFLDRDGVLNLDVGHAHRPDQLQWMPNATAAIRYLNDRGYFVFVVTNQAGVAKGLYDESAILAFHDNMQWHLFESGAHIDAFYYCPYHSDALVPQYRIAEHPDRKPSPGMILRAGQEWPIEAEGSFLIGDQKSDLEAAAAAGLPGYHFDGSDLLALVKSITSISKPAALTCAGAI
jgi:D-glycero-D-manno-heptose 1,7-bisphosphate phosphatase